MNRQIPVGETNTSLPCGRTRTCTNTRTYAHKHMHARTHPHNVKLLKYYGGWMKYRGENLVVGHILCGHLFFSRMYLKGPPFGVTPVLGEHLAHGSGDHLLDENNWEFQTLAGKCGAGRKHSLYITYYSLPTVKFKLLSNVNSRVFTFCSKRSMLHLQLVVA